MQALIDADLVVHRCAASAEEEPEDIALLRADKLMRDLLIATDTSSYRAFLTGSNNFRKEICPEYKANRKDKPPPKWLQQCREFLVREWKAEVQDGIEADDALGIAQCAIRFSITEIYDHQVKTHNSQGTIICSLDKDLLQIPGKHYRWQISGGTTTNKWTKDAEYLTISYIDGLRHFYSSSLIGDKSDNIFGVEGIGKIKAEKALRECETEKEMFEVCRKLYNNDERYFKNLKLLWIFREENDVFDPIKRNLINE